MGITAPFSFLLTLRGPSLLSLQGGWLRGPGLGTGEKVRLPGSLPPLASLGAGALWAAPSRPLWALCPTLASRLGEGSWGSSHWAHTLSYPSGVRSWACSPFLGRLCSPSGPRTPGVGLEEKVRFGNGGGVAKQL